MNFLRQLRSISFLVLKFDLNWLKNLYMFNQNRIYRVFQLINFLRTKPSKTPRSLADCWNFGTLGVPVFWFDWSIRLRSEKSEAGRFYIEANEDERIPFTAQEVDYIAKMVNSVGKKQHLGSVLPSQSRTLYRAPGSRWNIYDANLGRS